MLFGMAKMSGTEGPMKSLHLIQCDQVARIFFKFWQ